MNVNFNLGSQNYIINDDVKNKKKFATKPQTSFKGIQSVLNEAGQKIVKASDDIIEVAVSKAQNSYHSKAEKFIKTSEIAKTIDQNLRGTHYISSKEGFFVTNTRPINMLADDFVSRRSATEPKDLVYKFNADLPIVSRGGIIKQYVVDSCASKTSPKSTVSSTMLPYGGTFNDVAKNIAKDKKDLKSLSEIQITPCFEDNMSKAGYFAENFFHLNPNLGGESGYADMLIAGVKSDVNIINDLPAINMGINSYAYQDIIRRGKNSPYFNWFDVNVSSDIMNIGVLPNKTDNIKIRIVNDPRTSDYDASSETFVQMYDKRFVDSSKFKPKDIITIYDYDFQYAKTVNNVEEEELIGPSRISIPYYFPVNPKEIQKLGPGEIEPNNVEFTNFKLTTSDKQSTSTWDGMKDLPKLSYFVDTGISVFDDLESYEQKTAASFQVQDNLVQAATNLGRLSRNIILEYLSKEIKTNKVDNLEQLKSITPAAERIVDGSLKNAIDGKYYFKNVDMISSRDDIILSEMMDFPLARLDLPKDTLAVLDSAYISKKAFHKDDVGISRSLIMYGHDGYEAYANIPKEYLSTYKQMDDLYTGKMKTIADSFLNKINKNMPEGQKLFDEQNEITEYGRFALPLIMDDLTQFILYKSFDGKTLRTESLENGRINFKFTPTKEKVKVKGKKDPEEITVYPKNLSLRGLNAFNTDAKLDAEIVLNNLSNGLNKFNLEDEVSNDFISTLTNKLKDIDLKSLHIANMLMDQAQLGPGVRIDAAKDFANINAIRNFQEKPEKIFSDVKEVLSLLSDTIYSQNPHALIFSEVTDVHSLVNNDKFSKFPNAVLIEQHLMDNLGISQADYTYDYNIPNMYGFDVLRGEKQALFGSVSETLREKDINNNKSWVGQIGQVYNAMSTTEALNTIKFLENQDKPRLMHIFALDMSLFHSKLDTFENQKRVFDNLLINELSDEMFKSIAKSNASGRSIDDVDYSRLSSKSVAMGVRINQAIDDLIAKAEKNNEKINNLKALKKAVANFALKTDETKDVFGVIPIHEAVKKVVNSIEIPDKESITSEITQTILDPAYEKIMSSYKVILTRMGKPSIYNDTLYGGSGWEDPSRNPYTENRTLLLSHPLISQNLFEDFKKILNLRDQKELKALNDGDYIQLPTTKNSYYAVVRRNLDPKQTLICVHSAVNATTDVTKAPQKIDAVNDLFNTLNNNIIKLNKLEDQNDLKQAINDFPESGKDNKGLWKILVEKGSPTDLSLSSKTGIKEGDCFKAYGSDPEVKYKVFKEETNGDLVLKPIVEDNQTLETYLWTNYETELKNLKTAQDNLKTASKEDLKTAQDNLKTAQDNLKQKLEKDDEKLKNSLLPNQILNKDRGTTIFTKISSES